MINMRRVLLTLLIVFFIQLNNQRVMSDEQKIGLCSNSEVIDFDSMVGNDGPLIGCLTGDTVHFQVDPNRLPYSTVIARYCDLSQSIVIEKRAVVHIVCQYLWKFKKDVQITRHPDTPDISE